MLGVGREVHLPSLSPYTLPTALVPPRFLPIPGGDAETEFCASTLPAHFASVAAPNSRAVAQAAPPPLPAGDRGFVPEVRPGCGRCWGRIGEGGLTALCGFDVHCWPIHAGGSLHFQDIYPKPNHAASLPHPPSLWRAPRRAGRAPPASPPSPPSSRLRSCARSASTCLAWPAARSRSSCSSR